MVQKTFSISALLFTVLCSGGLLAAAGSKSGLVGICFESTDFQRPHRAHILPSADVQWGNSRGGDWSALWCGFIEAPCTGMVNFVGDFADGFRLTLDGKLVIDAIDGSGQRSGQADLVKGKKYPVVFEFSTWTGKAALKVSWEWPSGPSGPIPAAALTHDMGQLPENFKRVFLSTIHPPAKPEDPIRNKSTEIVAPDFADGLLPPVVGVQSRQVFRCNQTHPERADGFGYTYHHAPNLA